LSKPATSRGWVCVFCIVPVLAIAATTLLVFSPARHRGATAPASLAQPGTVTPAARGRVQANYAALPLAFEQNLGQADARVKYMARGNGYTLFLTANDAVFSLRSRSAQSESSSVRRVPELRAKNSMGQRSAQKDSTAVVRMRLVGGNLLAKVSASDQLPGRSNYFLGNDPSKWHSDVAHYARVSYQDVYPGVNMAFHGAQSQTEFDFVVAPGANPAPIGFHFTGAQAMKTDDSGNLVISSAAGDVLLHKPVAYQEQNGARQAVDARFVLKAGNQVRFELGNYDRSRKLVIDPSVSYAYSTYLGGLANDEGYGIAFDSTGDAYVTGQTASTNFPTVGGVPPNTYVGANDVFVTKIAADGSSLVYSTYVGGSLDDTGTGIAVDASGNAFVAGGTLSTDFPVFPKPGAFQTTLKGAGNAFVFELNSTGSTLTYSTYLGGTGTDAALGLALATDSSGDVYVVGKTNSTDFPTLNPLLHQATPAGGFVTKMNSSGSALVYSTYFGAGAGDFVNAVAVDSSNNVYVAGQTSSSTFYTTPGAFQTANGGLYDAFVTVINAAGNGYVYSTFLGGSLNDEAYGIAVDSLGDAYVTGATQSNTDFPVTAGSLQTTYGGNTDAFVTKLNPAGTALVYSTYLGGGQFDSGVSIAVDGSNNAYVTGQTDSTAPTPFPTVGATQSTLGGGFDAFVSEINSTGSALVFSTYLGGSGVEDVGALGAIAVDSAGANIYVTGNTAPPTTPPGPNNFPVDSAEQPNPGGGTDAFVVKYTTGPNFTIAATTPAAVAAGSSATSTVTLTSYNSYASPVNLTCTVTGTGSPLPACSATSFSTNPVTPTATSMLTITTSGGPRASAIRPRNFFYAMWVPIAGLSLAGIGFSSSRSRRKKMLGFLMLGMVMAALFLLPACGGSSYGGGGGNTCAAAPSVPTGLAASGTTSTSTTLNWTASTVGANCSVTKYTVYQNGAAISSPTTNTFNVPGLAASTTYSFTVSATDSYGSSAQSSAVMVTTGAGATPAGNYMITITGTGTDASATTRSAQVILTVN